MVAALVWLFYGLWIFSFLETGHEARDFIVIGTRFVTQSDVSSSIKYDPTYQYVDHPDGYDGQFFYYIALDPINARYYMDKPPYRYTRILYPITARLLALGQPELVPYALIAVNWLALGGGTLAVAMWLKRKGLSPWIALVFGLYPGLFVSLQVDLSEVLCYALVALAVYLFDFGGRRRLSLAGISFALAILTREMAAVFAVFYTLALLLGGNRQLDLRQRLQANWRRAAQLGGLALLPFMLYKAFLLIWLGNVGLGITAFFEPIPFWGLLYDWPWTATKLDDRLGRHIVQLLTVVLPALICAGAGVAALWKRIWSVEVWVLLAHVLLFVVFLTHESYTVYGTSSRIATGVVLAAIYFLPKDAQRKEGNRLWFWISSTLWLAPALFLLLPETVGTVKYFINRSLNLLVLHTTETVQYLVRLLGRLVRLARWYYPF